MTAAENKRLIRQAFDGLAEADATRFVGLFADDMAWIVTGKSSWSRRYDGKKAIQRELLGPLFERLATPFYTRAERIVADEEGNVVVLANGQVRTKAGRDYNNDYCFVFRMEGGKIVEVREYMDSALAEATLGPPPQIGG